MGVSLKKGLIINRKVHDMSSLAQLLMKQNQEELTAKTIDISRGGTF